VATAPIAAEAQAHGVTGIKIAETIARARVAAVAEVFPAGRGTAGHNLAQPDTLVNGAAYALTAKTAFLVARFVLRRALRPRPRKHRLIHASQYSEEGPARANSSR
jgi:hypothetical protein